MFFCKHVYPLSHLKGHQLLAGLNLQKMRALLEIFLKFQRYNSDAEIKRGGKYE